MDTENENIGRRFAITDTFLCIHCVVVAPVVSWLGEEAIGAVVLNCRLLKNVRKFSSKNTKFWI